MARMALWEVLVLHSVFLTKQLHPRSIGHIFQDLGEDLTQYSKVLDDFKILGAVQFSEAHLDACSRSAGLAIVAQNWALDDFMQPYVWLTGSSQGDSTNDAPTGGSCSDPLRAHWTSGMRVEDGVQITRLPTGPMGLGTWDSDLLDKDGLLPMLQDLDEQTCTSNSLPDLGVTPLFRGFVGHRDQLADATQWTLKWWNITGPRKGDKNSGPWVGPHWQYSRLGGSGCEVAPPRRNNQPLWRSHVICKNTCFAN